MKQYAGALFVLVSLGAVAAVGAGCDSGSDAASGGASANTAAGSPATGTAGAPSTTAGTGSTTAGAPTVTAGTGSTAAGAPATTTGMSDTLPTGATEVPIAPSSTGFVDSMATGIQGAWYSYGDGNNGATPMGVCQTTGMHMTSQCSMITTPAPGTAFAPAGTSMAQMCTSGTVAQIIKFGTPAVYDYSNIFGAGIGLDLNNPGLDGGTGVKQPYNATAHMVIGISFDLDAVPPTGLRVEFPYSAPDAGIWKPNKMTYASPLAAGHNILLFSNVVPPPYVAPASQVPFDPTTLLSVQFHVPTTTSSTGPYHFCLDNVSVIVQ